MTNLNDNVEEHPITTIKKAVFSFKQALTALITPVDPSEYIWTFGNITLNTQTGLFSYFNKQIQLRQHNRIYKIIYFLLTNNGNEVSYEVLAKQFNLPYDSKKNKNQTRETIKSSIRDLRRRLGINSYMQKDKNFIIMTGQGIKLAL